MEEKKKLIRPFSLYFFQQAVQPLNPKLEKKKIMGFFKQLDTEGNGSLSTEELIKLWILGKDPTDPSETLFKLLNRHLAEIQFPDALLRFQTLGYEEDDLVNEDVIKEIFQGLNLETQYIKYIESAFPNKAKVADVVDMLKTGGSKKSLKIFKKMPKP